MSRILHHHAPPARQAVLRTTAGTAMAVLALAVTACGSSSSHASTASLLGSSVKQDCTTIADVLSDGPDPDADPVGYAQAQVLPLKQLTITDARLHKAVITLADAYQAFSTGSDPGGTAAALKVAQAENAVNAICPGAAS